MGTDVPCPQDCQHHQSGTLLSHPLTGTHTAVPRPLRPASAFSKASESVLATWKTGGQQVHDRFGAGINQRGVQEELGRVWPRVKWVKTEGFVVISSQCPRTLSLPTMASGHQVLQTGKGKEEVEDQCQGGGGQGSRGAASVLLDIAGLGTPPPAPDGSPHSCWELHAQPLSPG